MRALAPPGASCAPAAARRRVAVVAAKAAAPLQTAARRPGPRALAGAAPLPPPPPPLLRAPVVARRRRPLAEPPAAAAPSSSLNASTNPLARALERELGVQSASLDPRVREAVEAAIERAPGRRLTAGDAAAAAGASLREADACLRALAYDCLASLEVSALGDVAYAFPRDFRAQLARKSLRVRAVPALRRAEELGAFAVRAAFGLALVASAALVWAAVMVLSSSSQRDDRRGGGGGGGGGGYYGGGRGGGMYLWVDPLDWFLFWDPRYARRQRARADRGDRLSFLEAVFSFVFGDGDPNEGFSRRRWRALAAHVRRLGGVVSAEELAPFLDPPRLARDARSGRLLPPADDAAASASSSLGRYGSDESFVLPALLQLNGEAFVDEASGRLLYRFPDLQATTSADGGGDDSKSGGGLFGGLFGGGRGQDSSSSGVVKVPLERPWEFSVASPGQQAAALALGVANLAGVVVLGGMLQDPVARLALAREGLGFVLSVMPWLQAYAFAFFAVPLVRVLVDARRNAAVAARNAARADAVELLREPPGSDPALAAKRAAARRLGGQRVVGGGAGSGGGEVVYTTESETDAQRNAVEEREFDERLQKAAGGDGASAAVGGRRPPGAGRRFEDVFDVRGEGGGGDRSRRQQQQQQQQQQKQRRDDEGWDRLDRW